MFRGRFIGALFDFESDEKRHAKSVATRQSEKMTRIALITQREREKDVEQLSWRQY